MVVLCKNGKGHFINLICGVVILTNFTSKEVINSPHI